MMAKHIMKILAVLTASLVSAQGVNDTAATLSANPAGGLRWGTPNYIDNSVFDTALHRPNATGSIYFTGRDVSTAYPGTNIPDWMLTVNVTSGIIKPGSDNRQLTGSAISIHQPDKLSSDDRNTSRDEFRVCVNVFKVKLDSKTNYTQLAGEDDGMCHSYLSDECRSALQILVSQSFTKLMDCPSISQSNIPASCGNITFASVGDGLDEPAFGLPAEFYENGWTMFSYGSDPPVSSNNKTLINEDYDNMVKLVYPVLITWGYSNNSTRIADDSAQTDPATSLACISATNFTEGSRVPKAGYYGESGNTSASQRVELCFYLLGATVFVAVAIISAV